MSTRRSRSSATLGRGDKQQPWRYTTSSPLMRKLDALGARIEPHPLGCWLWIGAMDAAGYGVTPRGDTSAHRTIYTILVGPIPKGMHLHHECENKRCVNPEHLTPMMPGDHMAHHAALRRAKT